MNRSLSPEWQAATVAPPYAHRQARRRNRDRAQAIFALLMALFVVWLWCQRIPRRAHRTQPVTLTDCPADLALLPAAGTFSGGPST